MIVAQLIIVALLPYIACFCAAWLLGTSSKNLMKQRSFSMGILVGLGIPFLYGIFSSCSFIESFFISLFYIFLLISSITDLIDGVVYTLVSLLMLVFGLIASFFGYIPLSFFSSLMGGIVGYGMCWLINSFWIYFFGRDALGAGDGEVCAGIGSWIGPWGLWCAVSTASFFASIVGIGVIIYTNQRLRTTSVPLVPFLYIGTFLYLSSSYFYNTIPYCWVY